jgi:hypothetical protein
MWNDDEALMTQQRCLGEKPQAFPSFGHGKSAPVAGGNLSSDRQRYVSFYFTNFPVQLSIFYLRKGFEVCGMLEDIYVARKRNKQGQPYGFVRYSNVRDVAKLVKALNAVCFGDFRVRARVARFDRYNAVADEANANGREAGVLGVDKAGDKPKDPILIPDERKPRVEAKQRSMTLAVTASGGFDSQEGVTGKIDGSGTPKHEDVRK